MCLAGKKLKWNHTGNWGHRHGVGRLTHSEGNWLRFSDDKEEGVAQDNKHQPDFKAKWHLTGRGHYYYPNISWSKANIK